MSITMDKEILIRVPSSLYARIRHVCRGEYKSISALIRELLLEKIEESLGHDEVELTEHESKNFHKGKGINWRRIKRG